MNIELQEIFCCHNWALEPIAGQQLYKALMTAIANRQEGNDSEGMRKTAGFFLSKNKSFAGKLYVDNIHCIENRLYWKDEELADDDQIVNVVVIDGAVTRNGGACTYGSKDHRDQVLYANTIPQVVGHIFIINTPGGMVSAMPDYTMAIENCRELGKPTVAFIDGMSYSAGMWIASQCDRIIAMNQEDGVGCIGAMSCGELAPHGSVNSITQERTIILVGKASPDKNREILEASKGNDELLQAEADKDTVRFQDIVRKNRPMVTSEFLTGKTHTAQETMGKLVDEIGNMDRAIECVFELANGSLKPAREAEPAEEQTNKNNDMKEEEKKPIETETEEKATQVSTDSEEDKDNKPSEEEEQPEDENSEDSEKDEPTEEDPKNEEEEDDEEDENPKDDEPSDKKPAPAQPSAETMSDATAEIDRISETLRNAEAMIEQKDKNIEALQSKVDKKSEDIKSLSRTIKQQAEELSSRQSALDKLTKQVADLKAEVKDLSNQPAPMVDAAAGVPVGNGTGDAPKSSNSQVIKPGMTYEQIRAIVKKK